MWTTLHTPLLCKWCRPLGVPLVWTTLHTPLLCKWCRRVPLVWTTLHCYASGFTSSSCDKFDHVIWSFVMSFTGCQTSAWRRGCATGQNSARSTELPRCSTSRLECPACLPPLNIHQSRTIQSWVENPSL